MYGYGISSFVLSLIETAIELTEGRSRAAARRLVDAGDADDHRGHRAVPERHEALASLSASYPSCSSPRAICCIRRRSSNGRASGSLPIRRGGQSQGLRSTQAILSRYRVEPARFLMVGNSLRSDVLPLWTSAAGPCTCLRRSPGRTNMPIRASWRASDLREAEPRRAVEFVAGSAERGLRAAEGVARSGLRRSLSIGGQDHADDPAAARHRQHRAKETVESLPRSTDRADAPRCEQELHAT